MTWSEVAVVVVAALLLLVWFVWLAANRLDRLHRKVASSRQALDHQLVRRASAAAEIAAAGVLDPASSVLLADAAWSALAVGGRGDGELLGVTPHPPGDPCERLPGAREREVAESDLSLTLRTALADPDEVRALDADELVGELLTSLAASWYRVQLARRFHNEAVAQTQRVRRKALVRVLRLHGRAAMPRTVEIDDDWPDGLPRPGHVG
ncbi:hypothetical protein [Actinotalea sp. Marseille-Q4924]|uniref:hypothetical protein n=1 Tax=Actinotalea sp. Marseille-Q4924 TaxID=2866571 RepID=UPI001CE40B57|nr:hypothetical protein [Actinotalea sp. Marseille-Q4924]